MQSHSCRHIRGYMWIAWLSATIMSLYAWDDTSTILLHWQRYQVKIVSTHDGRLEESRARKICRVKRPHLIHWWIVGVPRLRDPREAAHCEGEWRYTLLWCEMFKLETHTRYRKKRSCLWTCAPCVHIEAVKNSKEKVQDTGGGWSQARDRSFSATLALWKC